MSRLDNLIAAQAAARALNDLDIDATRPVDPFEAIDALGLELQFQPLKDLLGAILPGERTGVLINSARPASMQRFTAAHEIGHWFLDQDELAIDTKEDVEGMPRQQRERRAQIFASHFLMPLELLHATAARHGVTKGGDIAPIQAYEMARDMHVSYRAVLFQLVNSHFTNARIRDELLRVTPAQLKVTLTHGRKPENTRGDVWGVDAAQTNDALEVFVGDEVVIALHEQPSTGYRWVDRHQRPAAQERRSAPAPFTGGRAFSERPGNDNVIPLRASDEIEPIMRRVADHADSGDQSMRVGARVVRRVAFSATRPGVSAVEMDYRRPFSEANAADRVQIRATVRSMPDIEERQRRLRQFALEEAQLGEGTTS
jgi:Zn-dependent peptidase ImmA (M78 family)/predicted secreted protein